MLQNNLLIICDSQNYRMDCVRLMRCAELLSAPVLYSFTNYCNCQFSYKIYSCVLQMIKIIVIHPGIHLKSVAKFHNA